MTSASSGGKGGQGGIRVPRPVSTLWTRALHGLPGTEEEGLLTGRGST